MSDYHITLLVIVAIYMICIPIAAAILIHRYKDDIKRPLDIALWWIISTVWPLLFIIMPTIYACELIFNGVTKMLDKTKSK